MPRKYTKKPYRAHKCVWCWGALPVPRNSHKIYCSKSCRNGGGGSKLGSDALVAMLDGAESPAAAANRRRSRGVSVAVRLGRAGRELPYALALLARRVRVTDSGGCWVWMGRTKNGYGRAVLAKKHRVAAHRLALYAWGGIDAHELDVLHSCDTPLCCNPAHLRVGTRADNARDMAERERGSTTKLSASDVVRIRDVYRTGILSLAEIALAFGVTAPNVRLIVERRTWAHVA